MAADILSLIECDLLDAFADDVDRAHDLLIGVAIWFQRKEGG